MEFKDIKTVDQVKTKLLDIFCNDQKILRILDRYITYNFSIIDTFVKILRTRPKNVKTKELMKSCKENNLLTQDEFNFIIQQLGIQNPEDLTPTTAKRQYDLPQVKQSKQTKPTKKDREIFISPKKEEDRCDQNGNIKVSKMSPAEYKVWQEAQVQLFLAKKGLTEVPAYSPGGTPLNDAAKIMESKKEIPIKVKQFLDEEN